MERGARVVIRDAVLTTLLALLLVLSISMGDEAQFPAAAATSPAAGADHPTAEVGPGPSSALAVPASSPQQSHRVDSPSPALTHVLVGIGPLVSIDSRPGGLGRPPSQRRARHP